MLSRIIYLIHNMYANCIEKHCFQPWKLPDLLADNKKMQNQNTNTSMNNYYRLKHYVVY